MPKKIDTILLLLIGVLVIGGFLIFSSASLGLLAREGARFSSVAFNQIVFGIIGGLSAMFVISQIHYKTWSKYAFYIFLFTLLLTAAVFIPGIGFEHAGAKRWIVIGGFSFQPAEMLKIGFIIYMATWLSGVQKQLNKEILPTAVFCGVVGIVGIIMLLQPDTDTFLIMAMASVAMYLTAGGRWRYVFSMATLAIVLVLILALMRPYIKDRIMTFLDPNTDPLGSSYQVQQSLIAVGSGGITGRGFGQSIQKFEYLPEPIGDSVFAVYAEEFGLIGGVTLIALFSFFIFRGYRIASHAKDMFGTLLVVGFITIIGTQAFLNIAAMLGLMPMLGLPLPFISHGGTALLATLAALGIVLNVSRYQKR